MEFTACVNVRFTADNESAAKLFVELLALLIVSSNPSVAEAEADDVEEVE